MEAACTPHISPQRRHGLAAGGEGVDGDLGPVRGDQARRAARERRAHQRREVELAHRRARAVGDGVGGVARPEPDARLVPALIRRLALGAHRDGGHGAHRADRMGAHRGLLGEHHRVGPVQDRVGDVGDLRARGPRRDDHGVEHLRGRDRGPRHRARQRQHPLLHHRHLLHGQLDAQVAARDHHAVGDAARISSSAPPPGASRSWPPAAGGCAAHLLDVLGPAHERERHEVDPDLLAEAQVLEVALLHGGQLGDLAGDVDPLMGDDRAAHLHVGVHLALASPRTAATRSRTAPSAR